MGALKPLLFSTEMHRDVDELPIILGELEESGRLIDEHQ